MTAVQPDSPPRQPRLFGVALVRQKNVLERSWLRACGWRPAADRQVISGVCAVCSQRPFTAQKKEQGADTVLQRFKRLLLTVGLFTVFFLLDHFPLPARVQEGPGDPSQPRRVCILSLGSFFHAL